MVDRPKRTRVCVVDLDLGRRQRVFEHIVFDAVEAERPRGVETEGLQVACHNLHRRHPAGLHRRDETLAAREGIFRSLPPEPEA